MNEFKASNGLRVTLTDDGRLIIASVEGTYPETVASGEAVDALREFFRAEEDERLGRWRWPESPQWVVYPDEDGDVTVMDETTGESALLLTRLSAARYPNATGCAAARAYFDAHPEPKPWRNAQTTEVWELTVRDIGTYAYVVGDYTFIAADHGVSLDDSCITGGRRIWPESDE